MALELLTQHPAPGSSVGESTRLPAGTLRKLVQEHYDFIWRLLSRLGVMGTEVDDAAQQVFMVLVTREGLSIKPGSERAFLYGVALRVAKEFRRKAQSSHNHVAPDPERLVDGAPDLEAVAARNQARRQLDRILERMPDNLKEAFILFELEDLTVPQIAELLAIPTGTVASRLRRARAHFQTEVAQLREMSARTPFAPEPAAARGPAPDETSEP
ncbi:MAG TPA: sigma-70 family RNA polymerase sigma factor [Polyangiaceae bacterium]|nr:sigma-70 family RNA polymerase sigma factor [Polyangiaceae bacterium]